MSIDDTARITPPFTGEPWESPEKHIRIQFPEPGFCHVIFDGTPSTEELRLAILQLRAFTFSHSRPAILADMSRLRELPMSSRKYSRETAGNIQTKAIAIVGASFHIRVITTLLIKAIRLMKPEKSGPFVFVANEEEGWKWLKEQVAMP